MFKTDRNMFNPIHWINRIIRDFKISQICDRYLIENYKINRDGTVDVFGDVNITYCSIFTRNVGYLPIKFGKVSGDFDCRNNSLLHLIGSPIEVGGDFICSHNYLNTLEGGPTKVGGNFRCQNNSLKTLKGAPSEIGGNFNCSENRLEDLTWSPRTIFGSFDCSENCLESLSGMPDHIGGDLMIYENTIYSLPSKVNTAVFGRIIMYGNPFDVICEIFPDEKAFLFSLDWDYMRHNDVIFYRFEDACAEAGISVPKYIRSEYTGSEYEYIYS